MCVSVFVRVCVWQSGLSPPGASIRLSVRESTGALQQEERRERGEERWRDGDEREEGGRARETDGESVARVLRGSATGGEREGRWREEEKREKSGERAEKGPS